MHSAVMHEGIFISLVALGVMGTISASLGFALSIKIFAGHAADAVPLGIAQVVFCVFTWVAVACLFLVVGSEMDKGGHELRISKPENGPVAVHDDDSVGVNAGI